jgi:hypothetical protein
MAFERRPNRGAKVLLVEATTDAGLEMNAPRLCRCLGKRE